MFARAVLGTALVAALLAARGGFVARAAADVGALVALSLLGNVLPQWLQGQALVRSTAANTAWLVALMPGRDGVLARWLLGERLAAARRRHRRSRSSARCSS